MFAVEIPLLFENNLNDHFTKTICVHASSSTQNNRLKQKRIVRFLEIKLRHESQLSLSLKSNLADFVISCDGELFWTYKLINFYLKYPNSIIVMPTKKNSKATPKNSKEKLKKLIQIHQFQMK